jgi:uncharacterized protein YndB with AHSA1/START domain
MKALRVILIIVVVLLAAILIVPLFSPATAEVSAETTIAVEPAVLFPPVASYMNRPAWDPWLTQDSTADARLEPKDGYVGSTYSWTGEKVGTGRMEVISVRENEYIESSLWFGDVEEPALVEWAFEAVDGGTHVTWSFTQETSYPIGRLGMMFGKIFLKQSFELGLANLKEVMESMPEKKRALGAIAVQAMHTGPYEEFTSSYDQIGAFIEENEIEVSGEALEFYMTGMESESDPSLRETLIVFPLI